MLLANARYILFTLLLNKKLFLNLLNKNYFKKCKKIIIIANIRRRKYARRYKNIYTYKKHNYKIKTYINSIIYDIYYLIISIISTNIDVIIQKCIKRNNDEKFQK